MRLLWLTDFFPKSENGEITGGVEARCFFVKRHLESRGANVKIIARLTTGKTWLPPSLASVPERIIFTLTSIIKGLQEDFDIVEGTNFATYTSAWLIGFLKSKPVVFWYPDVFLGNWVENTGFSGYIGELVEKIILKLPVKKYIAISKQTREKLIDNGVNPNKIQVIYCGITPATIPKTENIYDVCAVSRMLPYKRLDDLILASNKLQLKTVILGRGPESERLKDLAGSTITFFDYLPKHSDVLRLISSAKVFCHPSKVEGFGISVLEAMNLAKPVVVSDISIMHETTADKGVIFFEPENIKDLGAKLSKILNDRVLYKKKSKEAQARSGLFNWYDISTQTLDLYKNILKPKILITTDAWRPVWGGGQEHILQTVKLLSSKYDIKIVAPKLLPEVHADKNVYRLGAAFRFPNIFGRVSYLFSVFTYQFTNHFDIIHIQSHDTLFLVPFIKFLKPKTKFIFTAHGKPNGWLEKPWRFVVEKSGFNEILTAAKATFPDKTVIGNGVNVDEIDKLPQKKSKNKFILVWVGRKEDPVKGLKFLESTFKNLKPSYPNLRLNIVSNKSHINVIKELKKANLFILSSVSEGLPLTILEAMAAKLPVVTTDVGDAGEIVRRSGGGLVVEPGSSLSLQHGIEKMLKIKNPKNGYEFVKKNYTWIEVADRIDKTYEKALRNS